MPFPFEPFLSLTFNAWALGWYGFRALMGS